MYSQTYNNYIVTDEDGNFQFAFDDIRHLEAHVSDFMSNEVDCQDGDTMNFKIWTYEYEVTAQYQSHVKITKKGGE